MAFEKGTSGNPGGRPKENNEVKQLARQHGVAALKRLVFWMKSDDGRLSVTAAQALLDRGYGKPAQAITGADGEPLIPELSIKDAARQLAFILAAAAETK